MNGTDVLNTVLWGVQGFLALFFLAGGAPKLLGRGLDQWIGFSDLPRSQVVITGLAEVVGAFCLVLPMTTGLLPWMTPLAAVGLAIIVLMASGFHIRARESLNAVETGVWAGIAAAVAIGRWNLVKFGPADAPWLLIAALVLLVPAAIINAIVLWKRSQERTTLDEHGDRSPGERTLAANA
jgi:drug/metabolite transporter superfamily protein YnfA